MCFHEETVGTDSYGSLCDEFDELRLSAGDAAGLVRLLQGMSDVHDDRDVVFLHVVYVTIIDNMLRLDLVEPLLEKLVKIKEAL